MLIAIPSFINAQFIIRVLQITENEVCHEHQNHKKTILFLRSPRKFLCIAVLSILPLRETFFFLTEVIFIEGAFKNIQGLLWKIQGLFKDIPQFFNSQGLFKACANHENMVKPLHNGHLGDRRK